MDEPVIENSSEPSLRIRSASRRPFLATLIFFNVCSWALVALAVLQWGYVDGPSFLLLLIGALALLRLMRTGTILTEDGITVSHPFRARSIRWSQVEDIEVRSGAWGRQARLVLRDGKVIKMQAPGDWWPVVDSDFDDNFNILLEWWARSMRK
jgi:hypothetical protein